MVVEAVMIVAAVAIVLEFHQIDLPLQAPSRIVKPLAARVYHCPQMVAKQFADLTPLPLGLVPPKLQIERLGRLRGHPARQSSQGR